MRELIIFSYEIVTTLVKCLKEYRHLNSYQKARIFKNYTKTTQAKVIQSVASLVYINETQVCGSSDFRNLLLMAKLFRQLILIGVPSNTILFRSRNKEEGVCWLAVSLIFKTVSNRMYLNVSLYLNRISILYDVKRFSKKMFHWTSIVVKIVYCRSGLLRRRGDRSMGRSLLFGKSHIFGAKNWKKPTTILTPSTPKFWKNDRFFKNASVFWGNW